MSTRTVGFAFAVNTAVIVAAQFLVLRWTVGRRRTRVFLVLTLLWAISWLVLALTGMVPGSALAAGGVILFHVFFGIGETLLNPTMPAIVNDLASDHLRGRYNATASLAFQLGAVAAPIAAGVLLHRGSAGPFIGLMLLGLVLCAALALRLEGRLSAAENGAAGSAAATSATPA